MRFPCSCPQGQEQISHTEDVHPVVIVKHDSACWLDSLRVSGVHLSDAVFAARIADAMGENPAAVGKG
ncbi:MAG: hypothetical protein VST64_10980 [Nitrospirota bacterium]|nr:hypothetical protein [Nitrospirota bacterium]